MGPRLAQIVLIAVVGAGILWLQAAQLDALERLAESVRVVGEREVTTYWNSGGVQVHVTTEPYVGESDAALLVRHTEAVKKKLQDYPRDP